MHGVGNEQAVHELGKMLWDPIGVKKVLVSTAVDGCKCFEARPGVMS